VIVDEARRDDPPVGLDRLARGPLRASDLDDLPLCDTDVSVKRGRPDPSMTRPFLMSRS